MEKKKTTYTEDGSNKSVNSKGIGGGSSGVHGGEVTGCAWHLRN